MNQIVRRVGTAITAFGFDPRRTLGSLRFLGGYIMDLMHWRRTRNANDAMQFPLRILPTLSDKYLASGTVSGHYFHQDLWAARHIFRHNPARHIDVGSRTDGLISHLLVFRSVDVLDIRPLQSRVDGLMFRQANLMSNLPLGVEPCESVSCLHALEHFGLGRYGDPILPDGWRTGLRCLSDLVVDGGRLYLSVPIGQPAVEFNAQRIFRVRYILDEARMHGLSLISFSYVDDVGDYHKDVEICDSLMMHCNSLDYGCGCFLFEKIDTRL